MIFPSMTASHTSEAHQTAAEEYQTEYRPVEDHDVDATYEEKKRITEEILEMMRREWDPVHRQALRYGVDPRVVCGQKRPRSPSPSSSPSPSLPSTSLPPVDALPPPSAPPRSPSPHHADVPPQASAPPPEKEDRKGKGRAPAEDVPPASKKPRTSVDRPKASSPTASRSPEASTGKGKSVAENLSPSVRKTRALIPRRPSTSSRTSTSTLMPTPSSPIPSSSKLAPQPTATPAPAPLSTKENDKGKGKAVAQLEPEDPPAPAKKTRTTIPRENVKFTCGWNGCEDVVWSNNWETHMADTHGVQKNNAWAARAADEKVCMHDDCVAARAERQGQSRKAVCESWASLLRHYRTKHQQPKRFRCEVCSRAFDRADALGRHRKDHTVTPLADAKENVPPAGQAPTAGPGPSSSAAAAKGEDVDECMRDAEHDEPDEPGPEEEEGVDAMDVCPKREIDEDYDAE
ncbi:hypothetical protein PYCCODRAFT_1306806 [Trametes coccinea BRFM310]|uniref:C2H2-type domain-containing protein n=1 Tax=Trametes coccinea (strain BRFM310) TaxID=1353009 RepID=A0A1Y2I5Q1_TRAC3|nr:hypothetical protein PYCCODRAFT_1306806 [Trametes coccinea BRFM310]